jgi:cysteine synthase A
VGFIPEALNRQVIDEVIAVTDDDAFDCARRPAKTEGIMAGVSSGAALHAALIVASRPAMAGTNVAVLLADTGERYITSPLFIRRQVSTA